MPPDQVLRILRTIRFSPKAGRPVAISWIARQSGYTHVGIFRAIRLGHITPAMARRLSPLLARIQLGVVNMQQGDNSPTLGPLGGGTGRIPVGRAAGWKKTTTPVEKDDNAGRGRPPRKREVETRDG